MRLFLILLFLVCAANAAPSGLQVLLTAPENGLDPAVASDLSSLAITDNLFESPLRYQYLARPLALQGNTSVGLPEVRDGGKTLVLRLKPGIFFAPDAAFQGKPRELQASDYVYSWQRLYDPALKSPWLFLLEGKLAGDEALLAMVKTGKFDAATAISGLQALDKYTLQIRLRQPEPNFLYFLAMSASSAVAREVVQAYGAQVGLHPVGTGPYQLKEWQRGHHLVLEALPQYRQQSIDLTNPIAAEDKAIAEALRGQPLPRSRRIEVKVVEEQQAYLLAFLQGEFDFLEQVPPTLAGMVLQAGGTQLKPELARKGITLSHFTPLQTYYLWMHMADPLLGGYSLEKIALRRAIALAYNRAEDIREQEKGLGLAAHTPVPPQALGFDARYRSPNQYNLRLANALLDRFGYRRDANGMRLQANRQPLVLQMHVVTTSDGRVRAESWRKTMASLGLRLEFVFDKKSEINKAARLGKVQMFETNWLGDYPDGENFLQLLYGPNSGRANYAHFQLPAYDKLYEQARSLPHGAARTALYTQMAQLIDAYNPWVLRMYPQSLDLQQAWLQNYRRHPVELTNWRYLDKK